PRPLSAAAKRPGAPHPEVSDLRSSNTCRALHAPAVNRCHTRRPDMKTPCKKWIAAALLVVFAIGASASSHREALAVLNEPCADNTDTYAWVSDRTHDKLYLIMNFNPLHEPGQGNQGLRACNGYRYEFHVGKGTSLADKVIYRVEF